MSLNTKPHPSVIREKSYDSFLEQIAKTNSRIHEVDEAIEWALIKDPKVFAHIGNNNYLAKLQPGGLFPIVTIHYHYNESDGVIILIDGKISNGQ